MATKHDARLLINHIVAAYNSHDVDALVAFYKSDVTYWSALEGLKTGVDAVREHIDHLHEILPDEKMQAQTIVTDGDLVVVEFESTGTNPVGHPYAIKFTEVFELCDGKVASIKTYLDPDEVADAMSQRETPSA
ncbi:MAG TPA: nuclear transport factor 2 family protein [Actinobacteria bacterium]|nr:nuclear transport factor 2 family protein [Actinomycetota bacterium]